MTKLMIPASLALASTWLLTACSTAPEEPATQADTGYYNDQAIYLRGAIGPDTVTAVRQLLQEREGITTLRVTAQHSDPLAAMQLGYLLQHNELALYIEDYCLDNCANYLFPAAAERQLSEHGYVAWSGGAREESFVYEWQSYILPGLRNFVTRYSDAWLRREARFYERIGITQDMNTYGFDPGVGCMQYGDYAGFYYDDASLLSLSLTVTIDTGPELTERYSDDYCRVDLTDRLRLVQPE